MPRRNLSTREKYDRMARSYDLIPEGRHAFCWVTDFPLVEWNDEEGRHDAMHHPFTGPFDEDLQLLETEPLMVRAKAYDIVLNGTEIGGGSIRIHRADVQTKVFALLNISEEEALKKRHEEAEKYNAAGLIYLQRKNYESAIFFFNKAITFWPDNPSYHRNYHRAKEKKP